MTREPGPAPPPQEGSTAHSPADLERIYSLAATLKLQILDLLATRPYDPDLVPPSPSLLLNYPRPMHRNVARASAARQLAEAKPDLCPYSPILRTEPIRRELLDEWQAQVEAPLDIRSRNNAASRILKLAMTRLYGSEIGKECARHTTRVAARKARKSARELHAEAFMGAATVPVVACCKLKIDFVHRKPGERFAVAAHLFLIEASYFARSINRRNGHSFLADGTSAVAKHARLCCQIMDAIGMGLHPGFDGEHPPFVRLTTIVKKLTGHKGGKRHEAIATVIDGLADLGFARWSTRSGPRAVRLLQPK